jgi:pimeloyl-ACP methyl ester carboxylesterase
MPELERPDGVAIHYDLRGEGPVLAMVPHWSLGPSVFEGLHAELAQDHCVLIYDLRGTGRSTRRGPYDTETDLGDLEALLEEAGSAVGAFGLGDSVNRIAKLASRRPDLLDRAICFGAPPVHRSDLGGEQALAGSDSVVDAFTEMVSRDYRGALRSMVAATNPQMEEAERQVRVQTLIEHIPQEAAVGRQRAWIADHPVEEAQSIGDRLCVIAPDEEAGTIWFPRPGELERLTKRLFPAARMAVLDEGLVSRPAAGAAVIRSFLPAGG